MCRGAPHQLCPPAVPSSTWLFVFLLQLRLSAFLWIYKSCGLSFITHQREITRINPFVPTVIKAWEGEMASSIFLQINNSRPERMPHVRDCGLLGRCRVWMWCQNSLLHSPGKPAAKNLQEKITVRNDSYKFLYRTSISRWAGKQW